MSDELEITPDDIQPYVAIGPTKDLSVTVHKSTFDAGYILAFIVVILLAMAIIILLFIYMQQQTGTDIPDDLVYEPYPYNQDVNLGGVRSRGDGYVTTEYSDLYAGYPFGKNGSNYTNEQSCLNAQHTQWNNIESKCQCIEPYFGSLCTLEQHDERYYAVGIPNEEHLKMNVLVDTLSVGKSFPVIDNPKKVTNSKNFNKKEQKNKQSCSQLCDDDDECQGFIYHSPGYCSLLSGDVIVPENNSIPYNPEINSTLYMKHHRLDKIINNLHFEHRIFLGLYKNSFPKRYWLESSTPYYQQLQPRKVYQIGFIPHFIRMYDQYQGIYALKRFNLEHVNELLSECESDVSQSCYLHKIGKQLSVPESWSEYLPIYVMYF